MPRVKSSAPVSAKKQEMKTSTKSSAPATKTSTKSKKAEPEPVVVETVVKQEPTEAVSSTPATTETDVSLSSDFASLLSRFQELNTLLSSVKNEVRTLEKRATRELKNAQKLGQKRKRKSGNRSPSGFVKPALISKELASFLGKSEGTEMARTDVTKEINAYIRKHNLQDKDNGRKINADQKLSSLLKLKKGDELTYFNLQKYMSPHFAKATPAVATTA